MTVHFTDREMQRAWRNNFQAYEKAYNVNQEPLTNAHRLLLFYAVECGLKAALMKRESANCTDVCHQVIESSHNINKLLDALKAGHSLKLPSSISMKGSQQNRNLNSGEINQMWRYGGESQNTRNQDGGFIKLTDEDLEKHLLKISNWIKGELSS